MQPIDFNKAFESHSSFQNWLGNLTLHQHQVGELFLPSGSVVACDALFDPLGKPFDVQLPPGRYPVVVSIAKIEHDRDERIACAMLRISKNKPVRWVMATTADQDTTQIPEDHIFGYPVETGTGCFMSIEAAHWLNEKMNKDQNYSEYLMERMQENYTHTRDWADVKLDPESGLNIVIFSTGLGDGLYASYWGYDNTNEVACLVTDFGLLDKDDEDPVT